MRDVRELAVQLMAQHGLCDWTFRFDNARSRYGRCSDRKRLITLSRYLVMMNPVRKTRDTILHEIAHALTPGHHHDAVWRAKAIEIGCDGKRCYGSDVTTPARNLYMAVCPKCETSVWREQHRRPATNRACARCCRLYNAGLFSPDFLLEWRKVESAEAGIAA